MKILLMAMTCFVLAVPAIAADTAAFPPPGLGGSPGHGGPGGPGVPPPGQPGYPGHGPGGPGFPPPGGPGGPGWGGPGGPGWGPRPTFECMAQNWIGERFVAWEFFPRRAEREALQQCYYYGNRFFARSCQVVACRQTF
jgi:hypothetical protein